MKFRHIDELARRHGINLTRPSPDNREIPISNRTKRLVLGALGVDLAKDGALPDATNAAAGQGTKRANRREIAKSYLPEFIRHSRIWGISLQLYELRSSRNWGIGDFEDLAAMVDLVAALGGDFIGLNPLHAQFLANPDRCSPYEPSNRHWLNALYIAVDQVPGFSASRELDLKLDELRGPDLVDYANVAQTKLETLRCLWRGWRQAAHGDRIYDPANFDAFVEEGSHGLRLHALFECLSFSMVERGVGAGWQGWPKEYRNCDSTEVRKFEREHGEEIGFHKWLQWLAHRQLTEATRRASCAGMRVGLYLDLAVGEAVDGSATWSDKEVYISAATIGSPPDPFAANGQDWRLAAFLPSAIASGKHAPYRRMLDATMRYAGAIRIDHAAALRRLFLVPLRSGPQDGAYVEYPQQQLLKILAEASAQHACLVIGEDLGLLPERLRDDLAEAQILSYRILSYERGENGFKPAADYPALALACISTHDHQTLAGWWRGADIEARRQHGIVPPGISEEHLKERKAERRYLLKALEQAGIDHPTRLPSNATDRKLRDLVASAHRFIARTPSMLAAVRLADLTGETRPTNIPGTSDSYPNWKPKLSVPIEDLTKVPLVVIIAGTMQEERGQGGFQDEHM
jgi:4-alpha-glucanotransferase